MKRTLLVVVAIGLNLTTLAMPGVAPNGAEFQVNTYTTDRQGLPALSMNREGDFVVAWASNSQDGDGWGVFAQMFSSSGGVVGGELQVNTYTAGLQRFPAVGIDGSGDFVVVWQSLGQDGSLDGVFAQRFDSSGGAVGSEFQVNTYITGWQIRPAVGMDGDGGFVVAWESRSPVGSFIGLFAQRYDSFGSPVGAEFRVNTYTSGDLSKPDVGAEDNGDFVVVWETENKGGSGNAGVFARRFDSSGNGLGTEFQVNTFNTGWQYDPAVGVVDDGDFVVAWVSWNQDGDGWGVFAQRFDSSGGVVDGEFRVNTYTTSHQARPAVVTDGDGSFVIAWRSYEQAGSLDGVFARMFDSSGSEVGGEFQVNTCTPEGEYRPAVGMDDEGGFVVAWPCGNSADGDDWGIFAQRVLTHGPALTSPTPGGMVDCSDPALNRPTFTWDVGNYDGFKVFMGSSAGFQKGTCVTSGDRTITSYSWTPSKKKWKRACSKAISQAVDPNNPIMYIAVRGVDRDLRKKDPLRKLMSFPVRTEVHR